jgi:hypothetical protein
MSLFLEMDLACIQRLSVTERLLLNPKVYVRILRICADVAENCGKGEPDEIPPRPPSMQQIRADLVMPGDYAWRDDLSFDPVASVTTEEDEVVITYRSGRTTVHGRAEHLRVAVAPHKAALWNEGRAVMDDATLRAVAMDYGLF